MNILETERFQGVFTPEQENQFRDNHERWQSVTKADIARRMDRFTPYRDGYGIPALIDTPEGDVNEARTMVISYPHAGGNKPHFVPRVLYARDAIMPGSRLVMLPQGLGAFNTANFSAENRRRLARGNYGPIGEMHADVLEGLDAIMNLGKLSMHGFSGGGIDVLATTNAEPDVDIEVVNADDAPHKPGRGLAGLMYDFTARSKGSMWKQAAHESDVPVIDEILTKQYIKDDSAEFNKNLLGSNGRRIAKAMTGGIEGYLGEKFNQESGYIPKYIGHIVGSNVFVPEFENAEWFSIKATLKDPYDLPYGHGSGDNIQAHMLMAAEGLLQRAK